MSHPYVGMPPEAFWKTAVAETDREAFPGLYRPAFAITHDTTVATAGSCFAQHIGRYLRIAGCTVLDAEPPPRSMPEPVAQRYGYSLFSGRYGNVYTARQMRQLLEEVADGSAEHRFVWENDGRYRDAFRPTVEPEGLDSAEEVILHRNYHLERTSRMLQQADVFVFTLGLTEAWEDRETGRVFPICPGVAGGTFDPDQHVFRNFTHAEILADLYAIQAQLRRFNPEMKLLVTVSPVPLTATATGQHVLEATSWSKATLRAAAGEFVAQSKDAAYFPSYEIVTHPASGGPWFEPNLRSVKIEAVEKVMAIFLEAHGLLDGAPAEPSQSTEQNEDDSDSEDDLICDDLLLQAFAG
ncbi:GSCFA domain-containing protein [Flavimaricola marinus]|uniref:GSCFA family protein n=1 Tax=Flavimaricola marinus TaxID=1819565 RepID=A0A238LIH3_9RHOB|nr:GSCFA domain-containing protein [Flavimaricola marinus]SMY08670.1 GSCFA family protein [Flavimaricola marinus]